MKSKLVAATLAAMFALQAGTGAFAHEDSSEMGPMSTDHPFLWGATSMPLRLVTGVGGFATGLVTGSFKGIYDTEQKFAESTWSEVPEKPLLFPVALIGSVLAVPVGVLSGGPKEAAEYGAEGYRWWNRF